MKKPGNQKNWHGKPRRFIQRKSAAPYDKHFVTALRCLLVLALSCASPTRSLAVAGAVFTSVSDSSGQTSSATATATPASASNTSNTPRRPTNGTEAPLQTSPSVELAQRIDESEISDIPAYCATLAGTGNNSLALAKGCEFALSVRKKLPDVICEMKTRRYRPRRINKDYNPATAIPATSPTLGADSERLADVVTATVAYSGRREYYDDIRIDGKAVDEGELRRSGAWSLGEFSVSLDMVFAPSSRAEFHYDKRESLHSIPALVFRFQVSAQNNKIYRLESGGQVWFPGYHGRVWLDASSFHLLRLEQEADYTTGRPITRMTTETDYSAVALGGTTNMVLPTRSDVLICDGSPSGSFDDCAHNIVEFGHWHKFRVTATIDVNPPAPVSDSDQAPSQPPSSFPSPQESEPADVPAYCATLAGTGENSLALAKVCEFAFSARKKLPDVICDLKAKRYWKSSGIEPVYDQHDVVTAEVAYRSGREHYGQVQINGKTTDAAAPWQAGAWSLGEFSLSLNTIFAPSSQPQFRYAKQGKLGVNPAVVFEFHVLAENNKSYRLQAERSVWFPEYFGRIWLDKATFRLLRLDRETAYMPADPIRRMKTETDYSLIALGDGTNMVLPTHSDVQICTPSEDGPFDSCARNILTFSRWRRFRATTNIVLDPK